MNILVTLNSNYLEVLVVMLKSLAVSNKHINFDVYVMNNSLTKEDIIFLEENTLKNINIIDLKVNDGHLDKAPVTKRYPKMGEGKIKKKKKNMLRRREVKEFLG